MSEFSKFLKNNGVKDIKKLTRFVHNFLKDPSIYFDLSRAERDGMEKKIDEALAFFKIEKR